MPFSAPLYSIGNVVYIRESAALGFIEAYAVESIRYNQDGVPTYKLVGSLKPPNVAQSVGDRVTGQRLLPIEFIESNLIDMCEALRLAAASLTVQLDNIESMQLAHNCIDDGTDGPVGTD